MFGPIRLVRMQPINLPKEKQKRKHLTQCHRRQGSTAQQTVVVTISGTNDVPTIDSATTQPPSMKSPVTAPLKTFLPPLAPSPSPTKTSRTHSPFLSPECKRHLHTQWGGGQVPNDPAVNVSALIASGAISFSDNSLTSTGGQQTIDWTYDPDAADLDWLAEGDTLTLTYTAQSTTVQERSARKTWSSPSAAPMTCPRSMALTQPTSMKSPVTAPLNIPATTGTITFTDQGLGDSLTLSVTGDAKRHYTQWGAEGTVPNDPAVDVSALIASGALSFSDNGLTSTGGQQTIDWTYDPDAADLDWLAEGDTLALTYTAQSTTVQESRLEDLVITISGTNDVPTSIAPLPSHHR